MNFRNFAQEASYWDYTSRKLCWFLDGIASGTIQIPDFQRNRRVTERHVSDLLDTVGEGLPIGDVILIEANRDSRMGFQAVRGTDTVASQNRHPTHLLVDGQQRLTPLFQALHSRRPVIVVDSGNRVEYRKYFIDMRQAILEQPLAKSLIAVKVTSDGLVKSSQGPSFNEPAAQFADCIIPTNCILDFANWENAFSDYWKQPGRDNLMAQKASSVCRHFRETIVGSFQQYSLPMTMMSGERAWQNVMKFYERVNGRPPEALQSRSALRV